MYILSDNAHSAKFQSPPKALKNSNYTQTCITKKGNTCCTDNTRCCTNLQPPNLAIAPDIIVSQVFSRGFTMSCNGKGDPSWPRSWKEDKAEESLDNEGYLANLRGLMRQPELDKYIALVPRPGYIIVDCDDQKTAETVLTYIEDNDLNPLIMTTDRGAHFTFTGSPFSEDCKNTADRPTALGVNVDYRVGGANGLVFARKGKVEVDGALLSGAPREFYLLAPDKAISPFPELLAPVSAAPAAGTCSVMASTGPVLEQAKPAPGAPAPKGSTSMESFDEDLDKLCQEVASKTKGDRNNTLNRCALCAHRKALGTQDPVKAGATVGSRLLIAALATGLGPEEINNTLNSARAKAIEEGPYPAAPPSPPLPGQEELGEREAAVVTALAQYQDKHGVVKYSSGKAREALRAYNLRYDRFLDKYTLDSKPFDDTEKGRFKDLCEHYAGMAFPTGAQHIDEPLRQAGLPTYDSLVELIDNLPVWDGKKRVERFFIDYCKAPDEGFSKATGLYFWTGAIGRHLATDKPCKADPIVVLVGAQGTRKTTLTHALCLNDKLWASVSLEEANIESRRKLKCAGIVEIPEMIGFSKKDLRSFKDLFGTAVDDYRPLYSNVKETYNRRCMFIMTTNETMFLRDPTGNRRFAPLKVGVIDIERVERDREQLYAEALELYREQGVIYKWLEELQPEHNAQFAEEDTERAAVEQWLEVNPKEAYTTAEIALGAFNGEVHKYKYKIASIMGALGYVFSKQKRINGTKGQFWELPPKPSNGTLWDEDKDLPF